MPTPAQTRKERINKLAATFKNHNTTTIEPIYTKALELFPFITKERAKDYAEAVLRMLKTKK